GDALRGERAPAVRSAEGMVRFPLLVQACPDEDVIDHPRLALESPERAAIGAVHRDGIKLVPALEATVSLDDSVKQIAHFSSFSCRFVVASTRALQRLGLTVYS